MNTEEKRTMWLHIRLRPSEHAKLVSLKEKSTCAKIGEYARRVILNKPVTFRERNQSMDDFMHEMIRIRTELNAIGVNFNQSIHRLNMAKSISDIKRWIESNELIRNEFMIKVDIIKTRIEYFADQWLQ
jgi:hypothetical protein